LLGSSWGGFLIEFAQHGKQLSRLDRRPRLLLVVRGGNRSISTGISKVRSAEVFVSIVDLICLS
jgi:hypothetical protein